MFKQNYHSFDYKPTQIVFVPKVNLFNQFCIVPLTTCYIVSIRCQTHKVLLVDVAFEGAQTMRLVHIPEFQLAVC